MYNKLLNVASIKYKLNLFFLKHANSLNFKHLTQIHIFLNLTKHLKLKKFKINFNTIHVNFMYTIIILNLISIITLVLL